MEVKMFNRSGQSAGKTSTSIWKIPSSYGWYLSGFADGEGSFNLSFTKRKDYRLRWKPDLSFNISQKDNTIPLLFQKILQCGEIRYRKDGVCYYEVRKVKDLYSIVIPFFKRFPLKSKSKKKVFFIFCEMTNLIMRKEHLTKKGICNLLKLRSKIHVGRKRKYSDIKIKKML